MFSRRLALIIFFICTSLVLGVISHATAQHDHPQNHPDHTHHIPYDPSTETGKFDFPSLLMKSLTLFWVFAVASSIGSFLNVVVYRMPRGMNLSHPKSHCPKCQTPISKWDNLPVIGWLKLRGKCRNCQCDISPRYPIVEAAVGFIALILFVAELLRGCVNLPHHAFNHHVHSYMSTIIWELRYDLMLITFCHAWLVIVLLVMSLIVMDGMKVPKLLLWFSLLFVLFAGIIYPDIYPIACHEPFPWDLHFIKHEVTTPFLPRDYRADYTFPHAGYVVESIFNWACGILMGLLLSLYYWKIQHARWSLIRLQGIQYMFMMTGGFLGWQGILVLALIFEFLRLLFDNSPIHKKFPNWMTHHIGFTFLCLIFILNWKILFQFIPSFHV